MIKFNLRAFILFLSVLLIEILIGLYVRDKILRPYGGDVLVIVLIYCFLQSFINVKPKYLIFSTLIFAFVIEVAQAFNFVKILGLANCKVMSIILGNSFSYGDLIAYVVGAFLCLPVSKIITKR